MSAVEIKAWARYFQDDWNLYGAQPLYMNLEEDGNSNAVFLLNSNAMGLHDSSPSRLESESRRWLFGATCRLEMQ